MDLFQIPLAQITLGAIMKISQQLQAVALGVLGASISAQKVFDLSTAQWTLSNPVHNISIPGSVPSQAHLDLHREGVIPDPYFGLGDFELRWVAETNWTYSAPLEGL